MVVFGPGEALAIPVKTAPRGGCIGGMGWGVGWWVVREVFVIGEVRWEGGGWEQAKDSGSEGNALKAALGAREPHRVQYWSRRSSAKELGITLLPTTSAPTEASRISWKRKRTSKAFSRWTAPSPRSNVSKMWK